MKKNSLENYGYYIAGFTDGEGSFNVSFRKRDDFLIGWKITPVFNISQDEQSVLVWIKKILNCGTIRFRKDGVWVFEVENKDDLQHIIIPFFKKFHFISHKKTLQFKKFVKIFDLIQQTPSLTLAHVAQILQWRNESQTKKRSHKYSDQDICARAELYWNQNQQIIQQKNGE